jgi:hypothetical protein
MPGKETQPGLIDQDLVWLDHGPDRDGWNGAADIFRKTASGDTG